MSEAPVDAGEGDADEREGADAGVPTRADLGVPDWEDEYLDRVADRLLHNYDLEDDYALGGERFDLYGEMRIESRKHFLHPSVTYGNHGSSEYLYARTSSSVTTADLERLVALGHDLAEGIDPDEEHFSTDYTFALVVPEIPEAVRAFVDGFEDRTLLRYGYYGHYEVNLLVVAPDEEDLVASANADVEGAFRLWEGDEPRRGLVGRLAGLFGR
ncbi:hypothetical protein [Halomarina ordinaria]|uniref:DUF8052 domain-containing protein n=1 Tax=Halomarina ordinaria TaxID=3033939 RepID=A0ABD5UCR0_9EURY|nr:hypothetical protein [Halomarina sp. PSRA2]